MSGPKITYVIHVAGTVEALWEALTSPRALEANWGKIRSSWRVGAEVTEVDDAGKLLWRGEVRRSEPPRVLSYTFDVPGIGEPPTEVTFELDPPTTEVAPDAHVVRLTLTQTGFTEDSKLRPDCERAWSEIVSSFKTYVETGRSLGFVWKH